MMNAHVIIAQPCESLDIHPVVQSAAAGWIVPSCCRVLKTSLLHTFKLLPSSVGFDLQLPQSLLGTYFGEM